MFERYTEKARRMIFFARYEASQFGQNYIETEHLLLAFLREDKEFASRLELSADKIRQEIEKRPKNSNKLNVSVDLPLSHECKRVLAYGAEESERLRHLYIGTPHLFLGLLREEKSFAASLLEKQGLKLDAVREKVLRWVPNEAKPSSTFPNEPPSALRKLLLAWNERPGIRVVEDAAVGNHNVAFAIFVEDAVQAGAAAEVLQIKEQIQSTIQQMEVAIGSHDFYQARGLSDKERELRELLRQKTEGHNFKENPTPILCVEIVHDESFLEVQKRLSDFLIEGVPEIWILSPQAKRAYIFTVEGLREFKGDVLKLANHELELELFRGF